MAVTYASFIVAPPGLLVSGEDQPVIEKAIAQAIAETNTAAGVNFDRIVELRAAIKLVPAGRDGVELWKAELQMLIENTFGGPRIF